MSATPARDALICRWADAIFVDRLLARPELVLAALIESGWRPTDDDLRAMGGRHRIIHDALHGDVTLWRFPKERNDG